jgi:hypothetical protein
MVLLAVADVQDVGLIHQAVTQGLIQAAVAVADHITTQTIKAVMVDQGSLFLNITAHSLLILEQAQFLLAERLRMVH